MSYQMLCKELLETLDLDNSCVKEITITFAPHDAELVLRIHGDEDETRKVIEVLKKFKLVPINGSVP